MAPEVAWRCQGGCLLVAAYATPAGVVLYFPTLRISRAYGATVSGHQARGALGNPDQRPDEEHVLRLPERAVMLTEEGVPLCCRHLWRTIRVGAMRADLARAHATDTPQSRTLSYSVPAAP